MKQVERINILKALCEDEPNDQFNQYALAIEYMNLDKKQSIEIFENLHKNSPNYLATYYQLGGLYFELEEYDKAKEIYEEGIEIAMIQNNQKTLKELKGAYQMLLDEIE